MLSLHFSSPPRSVPKLPVALREAADVADNVQTWSWRGAGGACWAGLARLVGLGLVWPGGWDGAGGDVPCWTVPWLTVFEASCLCRF
jgi:hypothetical protein